MIVDTFLFDNGFDLSLFSGPFFGLGLDSFEVLEPLGMLLLVFFGRFWDFEPFLCFSRVDLDSS